MRIIRISIRITMLKTDEISSAKKIELASVDDLFSTEEGRQDAKLEKIQEIPLSELHPFRNHPFKVKDDEAMMETADSTGRSISRTSSISLTVPFWRNMMSLTSEYSSKQQPPSASLTL